MNRRRADAFVGALVGIILLGGALLSWRAYRQRRALEDSMGSMMDSSMGTMHGPDPLWYVFGTLLVATAIGGVYLLVRNERSRPGESANATRADHDTSPSRGSSPSPESTTSPESSASPGRSASSEPSDSGAQREGFGNPESMPRARILDLLPDDERRVLEPVLQSPGITQIELRDRSDFSKSKVSQTVSSLEERGLLYREPQGRTYRVYASDDLQQPEE